MRKSILSIAMILALGASLTACRDTPKEAAAEESIENATDATEGALEKTGREIDEAVKEVGEAGEAVEDAVDDN